MHESLETSSNGTAKNKVLVIAVSYVTLLMLGIYLSFFQYTVLSVTQIFALNSVMLGLLIAMQSIGMAISPFSLGVLSGKIGKKKTVLISYALMIGGMVLAGSSRNIVLYMVSILIVGAGYAVNEATLSAVLADEYHSKSTRHINFSQVCFSLGAFGGPLIAQALVSKGVYFQDLYFYIAMVFLALAVLFFFTQHYNDHTNTEKLKSFSVLGKLKNRVLLLLIVGIFLYVGIETTVASFSDSYFELSLGLPELSATALSLYWLSMVPSRFLAGVLMKNTKSIFVFLASLMIVSIVIAMLAPNTTVKLVMFALCGFGCGPIWPLIVDRIAKKSKGYTSPMLNITFAFCGGGAALLPFIAGLLVESSTQSAAYYLCAISGVLMLAAYLLAIKTKRVAQEN
ncbi:MAG: MFS transporter [Clostridia bacterium]|jgi:fucose permease|nr:MFS transporter [Clostridia bacterium]MBT7122954.1 MFS transporter [Clostridia bacterium]